MALLNRRVDYSILVLSHLHQHPAGASVRDLADRFGLSRAFLANILKDLCHRGFVTSHRGKKGGYAIAPTVGRMNLADFISELDDSFRLAECSQSTDGSNCAVYDRCPVRGPIATVHGRIRDVLKQVTLSELFHPSAGPAPHPLYMLQVASPTPVA